MTFEIVCGILNLESEKQPMTKKQNNYNFNKLIEHCGHHIVIARYGKNGKAPYVNVSVECEDCNEVLFSCDKATLSTKILG